MSVFNIIQGDCTQLLPLWAKDGVLFDAVVCDPPYHLTSITKRFGSANAAPAKFGKDGAAARLSKGFQGQVWDGGDIAFRPDTWRAVASVVKPGGRLVAFGGTRTWHRLTCAIEDAGWIIEDSLMWVFGQGLVLSKTRLKPAWQPIVLARKVGRVQDLNIDACRMPTDDSTARPVYAGAGNPEFWRTGNKDCTTGGSELGRWPANLIHDGSDDVVACFPNTPGQLARARTDGSDQGNKIYGALKHGTKNPEPRGDTGSAARFFNVCPFSEDERRLLYYPKAGGAERVYHCTLCHASIFKSQFPEHQHDRVKADGKPDYSHISGHPTVKNLALMRHLTKLVTPPGGLVLDPFAGSGTTLEAAYLEGFDSVGIEQEPQYVTDIHQRMSKYRKNAA